MHEAFGSPHNSPPPSPGMSWLFGCVCVCVCVWRVRLYINPIIPNTPLSAESQCTPTVSCTVYNSPTDLLPFSGLFVFWGEEGREGGYDDDAGEFSTSPIESLVSSEVGGQSGELY